MLICSTPYSKGEEAALRISKELGIEFLGGYEDDGNELPDWEGWPTAGPLLYKTPDVRKWITSRSKIYHLELVPTVSAHAKALRKGKIVVILRQPEKLIGALDAKIRTKRLLELLRIYHRGWYEAAAINSDIMIVNYDALINVASTKSVLVAIAKHLGLNYSQLQEKPYNIILK